jgi:poly(3-hydroxyalkanoate) synthetase
MSRLLEAWFDGTNAALAGTADCLARTATGRPPDLTRWLQAASARRTPAWATPHTVVLETPLARVRDFSTAKPRGLVPTLVLPPQAGHDSCIVDYSPEQSQMRAVLGAGLQHALSLDWVGATRATRRATVEDYVEVIDRAVAICGGRANLIGNCQGGWLASVYAALRPERVNTLTIAGAPIDFHAGEGVINELVRTLAPGGDLRFYETLVAAGGGVLKGRHMLSGFILIRPRDEITRQFELLQKLDDAAHVARYSEFEDWFKHTQDIPGAFYLWIVRHLFCNNELVAGELMVGGQSVDLGKIEVPLNLLVGESDHITPPAQVFALADHAATPAGQIHRESVPGGHLGLFMGHRALHDHWPTVLEQVARHSLARRPALVHG